MASSSNTLAVDVFPPCTASWLARAEGHLKDTRLRQNARQHPKQYRMHGSQQGVQTGAAAVRAERARQRILARLFCRLGMPAIQALLDSRKNERRIEIRTTLPEPDRAQREQVFAGVFAKVVHRELQSLQFAQDASDPVNSRTHFLDTLSFLLDRITNATPTATQGPPALPTPSSKPSNTRPPLSLTRNPSAPTEPTTNTTTIFKSKSDLPSATDPSVKVKLLELELLELKQVHQTLNASHTSLRYLYNAAVNTDATTPQALDHRRSILLKSHLAQLQRQVTTLGDSVSARDSFRADAGQELRHVRDKLKSSLDASESTSKSKSKNTEQHNQVIRHAIQALDGLQKQLVRQDKLDLNHDVPPALEFMNEFIHPERRKNIKPVSLLDACSGSISHLNLRHVGRLESQLHRLFHDLKSIETTLSTSFAPNIALDIKDQVQTTLDITMSSLVSTMNSLLSLSVLLPVAPLPEIGRVLRTGFPTIPSLEEAMSIMPAMNPTLSARIKEIMAFFIHAIEAYKRLHDEERSALQGELDKHRATYEKYTTSMGQAVNKLDESRRDLAQELTDIRAPVVRLQKHMLSLLDGFTKEAIVSFLEDAETALGEVVLKVDELNSRFCSQA
ncbi:hypothetical protein SeLEV6574_g02857 [Synchytrium endobioticum]|uniref:Uncharacterized protein n=1 Tax=Synchytrium endobioticum TaxID=286115 RepID=A0A507D6X0_9FUNG|nr:hypothetical protein SeLEV6574_g02857 [Synchytrium endobioticum]